MSKIPRNTLESMEAKMHGCFLRAASFSRHLFGVSFPKISTGWTLKLIDSQVFRSLLVFSNPTTQLMRHSLNMVELQQLALAPAVSCTCVLRSHFIFSSAGPPFVVSHQSSVFVSLSLRLLRPVLRRKSGNWYSHKVLYAIGGSFLYGKFKVPDYLARLSYTSTWDQSIDNELQGILLSSMTTSNILS